MCGERAPDMRRVASPLLAAGIHAPQWLASCAWPRQAWRRCFATASPQVSASKQRRSVPQALARSAPTRRRASCTYPLACGQSSTRSMCICIQARWQLSQARAREAAQHPPGGPLQAPAHDADGRRRHDQPTSQHATDQQGDAAAARAPVARGAERAVPRAAASRAVYTSTAHLCPRRQHTGRARQGRGPGTSARGVSGSAMQAARDARVARTAYANVRAAVGPPPSRPRGGPRQGQSVVSAPPQDKLCGARC